MTNTSADRIHVAMEILRNEPELDDWAVRKKACDARCDLRQIDMQVARLRLVNKYPSPACECDCHR
jgi:hypothetical protein